MSSACAASGRGLVPPGTPGAGLHADRRATASTSRVSSCSGGRPSSSSTRTRSARSAPTSSRSTRRSSTSSTEQGATLYGVSCDSMWSQKAFKEKLGITHRAAVGLRAQGRGVAGVRRLLRAGRLLQPRARHRRPRRASCSGATRPTTRASCPARTSSSTASPPARRAPRAAAARSPRGGSRRSPPRRGGRRGGGPARRAARSRSRSGPCRVMQRAALRRRRRTCGCGATARRGRGPAWSTKRWGGSHAWIEVSQRDRDAAQPQAVLDQRPDAHRDRRPG